VTHEQQQPTEAEPPLAPAPAAPTWPSRCPFGLTGAEELTVTWSIGRYPDILLDPLGDDRNAVLFTSEANGLVRYDLPSGWVDDEFEFWVAGTAFVANGNVVVTTDYR
jgi:hypothetical protein